MFPARAASSRAPPRFENDRKYVEGQLRELIDVCAEVTGKSFDIDRLREVLGYANEMSVAWRRILELNAASPSLFNALTDGTIYLGVANALRGTKAGAQYFNDLVEEMEYKSQHGIGTLVDEEVPAHVRRRALLPDLPPLQRALLGVGRDVRHVDLPVVRVGRKSTSVSSTTSTGRSKASPRACSSACATRWIRCSTATA